MVVSLRRRMVLLALTALVAVALTAASALPAFAVPKRYACEDPAQPGIVFILSKQEASNFEETHPGAVCTEQQG